MKLQSLTDNLIEHVKNYGILDTSINGYRTSCNRLIQFATAQNTTEYSPDLLDDYSLYLDNQLENEIISFSYHKFQKRVLHLLRPLAETGETDFAPIRTHSEKYPVPTEDHVLIEEILDSGRLTASVRIQLSVPIRHFFWYAHENGYPTQSIDDVITMKFLSVEAPKSNASTMGRVLRGIKLATTYMKEHHIGTLKHDYTQLKSRSEPSKLILPFSEKEIRRLAEVSDVDSAVGVRNHTMILLAYETGLRGIDIVQLKLADVDWRHQNARVYQSKTATPLVVELNGSVMNALADYVLSKRPTCNVPEVFVTVTAPYRKLVPSFAKMINRYCKAAGIPKVPLRAFHSLRRSFESTLVSKGVPIGTVSAMAGHKDIESDKPYITFDKDRLSFISMGFSDVPIRSGIYAGLFGSTSSEKEVVSP